MSAGTGRDAAGVDDEIISTLRRCNPKLTIGGARRLGSTETILIIFQGKIVPYYVHYEGCALRCRPFRQKVEACTRCRQIGHRQDVCTNTSDTLCPKCGLKDAPMDHETSVTMFVLCAMETMKQVHRCVDNDLSRALHGPWKSKTHPSTDLLVANKLTVQASGKVEAKARNAGGKVEAKARNAGDAPVPAKVKIAVVAPIQRRKTTPGQPYHQALLSPTLRSTHTR
ncbi:hypothetical protein MRX96_006147 [Rhipicephalus microplus]